MVNSVVPFETNYSWCSPTPLGTVCYDVKAVTKLVVSASGNVSYVTVARFAVLAESAAAVPASARAPTIRPMSSKAFIS